MPRRTQLKNRRKDFNYTAVKQMRTKHVPFVTPGYRKQQDAKTKTKWVDSVLIPLLFCRPRCMISQLPPSNQHPRSQTETLNLYHSGIVPHHNLSFYRVCPCLVTLLPTHSQFFIYFCQFKTLVRCEKSFVVNFAIIFCVRIKTIHGTEIPQA